MYKRQAEGYGGAIYTNSVTAPYLIDISVDDSYSQNGGVLIDENNSAAGYGDGPSTAAGGFMYLGLSEVTFDIADGKTLVIGNTENDGAVDSIAAVSYTHLDVYKRQGHSIPAYILRQFPPSPDHPHRCAADSAYAEYRSGAGLRRGQSDE